MRITFNLHGLMCGGLSVAAIFLSTLLAPLFIICPLPLFWLGLTRGSAELYGGAIIGTLLLLLGTGFQPLGFLMGIYAIGLPTLLARRALMNQEWKGRTYWYPANYLTRDMWTSLSVLCALIFGIIYPESSTLTFSQMIKTLKGIDPQTATLIATMPNAEGIFWFIMESLSAIMTLIMAAGIMVSFALAQGIAVRKGANKIPTPDITKVVVSFWVIALFLAGLGSEFLFDGMIQDFLFNLGLVASFPLFLSGMGLVHGWLRPLASGRGWLIAIYMVLSLFLWLAIPIVILGIYHSFRPSESA